MRLSDAAQAIISHIKTEGWAYKHSLIPTIEELEAVADYWQKQYKALDYYHKELSHGFTLVQEEVSRLQKSNEGYSKANEDYYKEIKNLKTELEIKNVRINELLRKNDELIGKDGDTYTAGYMYGLSCASNTEKLLREDLEKARRDADNNRAIADQAIQDKKRLEKGIANLRQLVDDTVAETKSRVEQLEKANVTISKLKSDFNFASGRAQELINERKTWKDSLTKSEKRVSELIRKLATKSSQVEKSVGMYRSIAKTCTDLRDKIVYLENALNEYGKKGAVGPATIGDTGEAETVTRFVKVADDIIKVAGGIFHYSTGTSPLTQAVRELSIAAAKKGVEKAKADFIAVGKAYWDAPLHDDRKEWEARCKALENLKTAQATLDRLSK